MSLRKIFINNPEYELKHRTVYDEKTLRTKCKPVTDFNEGLWELLDDMRETMEEFDGVGIAAPQVGILRRAVIVNVNNMLLELINPEIISSEGVSEKEEGCLSVPEKRGIVSRPKKVTVTAQDRLGYTFTITGEELLARCLCHEIDHLDGILYVDKMIREVKKGKGKDKD